MSINDYGSESETAILTFKQTIITTKLPPFKRKRKKTEWIEEMQEKEVNNLF